MIDTRTKRQCAAQVGCPLPPSVLPSGTIDAAERQQIGWTYRGIAASTPTAGGGIVGGLALMGVGV